MPSPRRARLIAVVVLATAAAACGPAGSGDVVTQERHPGPFDRISVAEGLDLALEIEPGAATRVAVVYDDNLVDSIGTTVTDGELRIEILQSFRVTGSGRLVEVVVGDLEELAAESGADVRATGEIDTLAVKAGGGASLDLSLLQARRVVVDASGGAYVALRAAESVTGTASGGAEVLVLGGPGTLEVATSGGAEVTTE